VVQGLEAQIRKLQDLCWSGADPDGRAFVLLADAHRRAAELLEARRVLREGLNRHPDFASGHVVSAWVSRDQGKGDEAVDSFRAALDLDPRNIAALRGLAELLLEAGELGSALAVLEDLLEEDPMDVGLPDRIKELKAKLEEPGDAGEGGPTVEPSEDPLLAAWGDLDVVAEELDWGSAALQEDSGEMEEGGGGEEGRGPEPDAPEVLAEVEAVAESGRETRETDDPQEGFPEPDAPEPEEWVEGTPEPWVAEDGVPAPSLRGGRDSLVTPTLGEIYLRQGYLEWAEEVFLNLVDRDPGTPALRERLAEIQSLRRERERVTRTGQLEPSTSQPDPSSDAPGPAMILTIGGLTREAVDSVQEVDPSSVVPVQDLAPDEIHPNGILAPELIVPVESLAPELIVPVESLAPELIVPVESLAPDTVVPVESLLPDPPREGSPVRLETGKMGEPRREEALDAFQAWLESLE
jgi:tetratricopeptide (TPR) repeat protein